MRVAFYITATGEITKLKSYEPDDDVAEIIADMPPSHSYKIVPDDAEDGVEVTVEEHYVLADEFEDRPLPAGLDDLSPIIYANGNLGVDAAEGIFEFTMPAGTTVYSQFHGTLQTAATSQLFTFKTLRKGIYGFTFTFPFPYKSTDIEIQANAF